MTFALLEAEQGGETMTELIDWDTEFEKELALLRAEFPDEDEERLRKDVTLGLVERGLNPPLWYWESRTAWLERQLNSFRFPKGKSGDESSGTARRSGAGT